MQPVAGDVVSGGEVEAATVAWRAKTRRKMAGTNSWKLVQTRAAQKDQKQFAITSQPTTLQ